MTSTFHYVHFRAFAHATEDPEKVKQAIREAAGVKAEIRETIVEGSHKNEIRILEAELKGRPAIDALFAKLAKDDPTAVPALRRQMDTRLDDDQGFFFRLAKQSAFLGALKIANDDDAIQVRAKVASFPARRDAAQRILDAYLSGFLPQTSE